MFPAKAFYKNLFKKYQSTISKNLAENYQLIFDPVFLSNYIAKTVTEYSWVFDVTLDQVQQDKIPFEFHRVDKAKFLPSPEVFTIVNEFTGFYVGSRRYMWASVTKI